MKKLMLVLVMVAFASMSFGCNGTDDGPTDAGLNFPDWFLSPPVEPGVAIYGTGVFPMADPQEITMAKTAAAATARREIADSMKVTIQGVLKSYSKKIVAPSKKTMFESLTQDVMRQITNNEIYGAAIQKQAILKDKDGSYLFFALVRIGFDGVAKVMSDSTRKEFEKVEENAAKAFDEMNDLLKAQTEKPYVMESAKPYVQAPTPK